MKKFFSITLFLAIILVSPSQLFAFDREAYRILNLSERFANAYRGKYYSSRATATGDSPPYSWKFVSGKVPPDLEFGSMTQQSLTLSGTPTTPGKYEFRMTLNSANYEKDFTFTIRVYQASKDMVGDDNENTSDGGSGGSSGGGGCETGWGILGLVTLGLMLLMKRMNFMKE